MAAAWFNHFCDRRKAKAISTGTILAQRAHPLVVQAMQEVGIDLGSTNLQLLTDDLASRAALIVTMGCGDPSPFVPGLEKLDWDIPDPQGQPIESVRRIRDEILHQVLLLAAVRYWL
jgi:arsenate reductase (thioredoxin)